MNMTPADLRALMAEAMATAMQQVQLNMSQGGGQERVGAAAAGSLQPCQLRRDKTIRYQIFRDWITQAEAKMGFLGITESKQKIGYLRSNAGAELTTFFEKEVRARFSDIAADAGRGIQAQQAHTYEELIAESNKVLLAVVSRDRAVIDLLRMSQGDKHAMEFVGEVEDQARLCRADTEPITETDLKRMVLIGGMKDRALAEKALAEKYDLKTTIETMQTRETSKANATAMRGLAADTEAIKKIERGDSDLDEDIEQLERELQIMKLRRTGKYSSKGIKGEEKKCRKCSTSHSREEECPAKGKTCYKCEGFDHFARSPACPGKKTSAKRLEESQSSEDSSSEDTPSSTSRNVKRVQREWPGSRSHAQNRTLKRVANKHTP